MGEKKYKRCVTILADGARADVMKELLEAGQLPNIERELLSKGSFATGVTTFPSTTGPAYLPYIVGRHPGSLNVPGIRWFDKEAFAGLKKGPKYRSYCGIETFKANSDIQGEAKSIFELIPNAYSIFNPISKSSGLKNVTPIVRIWYWYYAHMTDRWDFLDKAAAKITLKTLSRDFSYLFVVFPGIDEFSHLAHPKHEQTHDAYRYLDKSVGLMISQLKKENKWDETLFWIVSDHGLSETKNHFCVNEFMENHNLPCFYYPKVMHRKGKKVANMMSGNGMTHLYFKNEKSWGGVTPKEKIDEQVINSLREHPAVELMACRNEEGGIDVLSKRGEAKIKVEGNLINYKVVSQDPFGYGPLPEKMNSSIAFEKTWNSHFPDGPWQIGQLFKASRTGDVVLSATSGYDFRKEYEIPEHKGSHGSLNWEHMHIPVITNAKLDEQSLRSIDIFPTTLSLMDYPIPKQAEGRVCG